MVIGSNLSATLAYGFGRAFGQGVRPEGEAGASAGVVIEPGWF